jgi:hypothetical protein
LLERAEEDHEKSKSEGQCPSWDLNQAIPENMREALPLEPICVLSWACEHVQDVYVVV